MLNGLMLSFTDECIQCFSSVTAQVGTSILPYLKLWPVDTYVDLMIQVTTLLQSLANATKVC